MFSARVFFCTKKTLLKKYFHVKKGNREAPFKIQEEKKRFGRIFFSDTKNAFFFILYLFLVPLWHVARTLACSHARTQRSMHARLHSNTRTHTQTSLQGYDPTFIERPSAPNQSLSLTLSLSFSLSFLQYLSFQRIIFYPL